MDVGDCRADRMISIALEVGLGKSSTETPVQTSRTQIQKLLEAGFIVVDEKPLKSKDRLQAGQIVLISFPAAKALAATPQDLPIDILFEDEHLLVVNKPQGLTVHPSSTQLDGTLVNALLFHIKDLSGIGGTLRPGIVHRIDKNTSGALVITKTDLAHQKLMKVFASHAIDRTYWALCYGIPKTLSGTIETTLGRSPSDRKKMAVNVKGGRKAISHYKVLESFYNEKGSVTASWIEVKLETGRTHQVRVHLTALGCSIMGDPAYGAPTTRHTKWTALSPKVRTVISSLPGQALHARVLGFEHPVTGKKLHFEAEPPELFKALLSELKAKN
ncbi:MAG: hypothetical protein A2Z97_01945 [Bdellovibrionales bacterium GWB1_52_6]|nr:MAG: hypothetical protein A2Z97_01945 [Bdellovibrionales bacterium GWB1_52_6]OFZ04606.1 MAG: hypothetical protein A2X97_13010 [Bdellovibrionales bacterium GWA1_52_35]